MKAKVEQQIDELYALPLDEFTRSRNALAKTLSGGDRKTVASLVKPSLAMWVVNQLYWQDAPAYKALVDASERLRAAHRAALNGRNVDTSKPDELHRTTLEKAFARAVAIAQNRTVSLTDAVRDAVRRTLAALPTDERPGRLTREPPAVGFSLLTGIKPRRVEATKENRAAATARRQDEDKESDKRRKEAEAKARREEEKARKAQEKKDREIRKAEQALREAERRLAALKG